MSVDAVGGDVEGAILVPLDGDVVGSIGGILHARVGLDPVDALADLAPELVWILNGTLIHRQVFGAVHPGAARPFGGYVIDLVRHSFLPGGPLVCPYYRHWGALSNWLLGRTPLGLRSMSAAGFCWRPRFSKRAPPRALD